MNSALFMALGLLAGSLGTAMFVRVESMTTTCDAGTAYTPISTLQAVQDSAIRCDRELLTCLGVQVRVIQEIEALHDACINKQKGK